jgi:hypothetical protein
MLEAMKHLMSSQIKRKPNPKIARLVKNHIGEKNRMIDTETGLEAALVVGEIADERNISWALCGRIAMHLYGSPRLTKDVDLIASALLPLSAEKKLNFGGTISETNMLMCEAVSTKTRAHPQKQCQ